MVARRAFWLGNGVISICIQKIHLGGFYSHIARGTIDTNNDGEDDTPEFEQYSSKRAGFALGQHLDLVWYFFLRKDGAIGWMLRFNIDEVKSFGIAKYHQQFNKADIPKYGIEFYPSISIGIKASL